MSTTRLVVLGAVRAFQPVHGYFLRRELISRQVDEWANINPGSIYNALRVLTRDGFLEEVDTGSPASPDARPARTTYQLTIAGETEFMALLRDALRKVEPFDTQPIMAALSFMDALTRQEAIDAVEHRAASLDAELVARTLALDETVSRPTKADLGREMVDLTTARLQAELEWARVLVKRLWNGEYRFADEL